MAFIVDAKKFQAEGAVVAWSVVARRLGFETGNLATVLHLRWMLNTDQGLPTEPFVVWRRDRRRNEPKPIEFNAVSSRLFGLSRLLFFDRAYAKVFMNLSGSGGVVYGFVGQAQARQIMAIASVPAGVNRTVELVAPAIEGVALSTGTTVNSITGIAVNDLTATDGWEELELVGLPVEKSEWAGRGIGAHGVDQGMFGAFTDAHTAAMQRLVRGMPPIGWPPQIEPGLSAPTWMAPIPAAVIDELQDPLLLDLRSIAAAAPGDQRFKLLNKPVPPPQNASGQSMSEPGSTSNVSPLGMTYLAAGTDCFNCMALGFGTAYAFDARRTGQPNEFDYMITARFEKGADGQSSTVDLAALVPTPSQAILPPIPVDMLAQKMGDIRPSATDRNWRASMRASWERPILTPLFRPRSFAFSSAGISPASPAMLIMNKRLDGSPRAVAINYFTHRDDVELNRVSAVEREIPVPNNPGSRSLKFAVAHQDIYGQWSRWVSVVGSTQQPPVDDVRIASAELRFNHIPSAPQTLCTADLVLEFLWDWRIRSPLNISFRGRLFAADFHGQPPADDLPPGGLQTSLGGPVGTTFTLRFNVLAANGAPTAMWPGFDPLVHCVALDISGEQTVAFGAAQGAEARRYRITIPGFGLDFASTGHIGLALWAQGQEALAPQHVGGWSPQPRVVSTSDPRPPLIIPDIVDLTSLPDASGQAHAILKWSASPGAAGYFIYESSESRLRAKAKELGFNVSLEPDPSLTLSQRLTQLKNIFNAHASELRSTFTRLNSRLITLTSVDVSLPRGTTSIHVYIVQGLSAGQVEALWPTTATSMVAFAVPRVPKPAPPTLEVASFLDPLLNQYRSRLRLETRPGPRVKRIELYRVRVDDAARELDTMGPPVATIDSNSPGWDVTQASDGLGPHITLAQGVDAPSESWRRVWYRAVAWSGDDLLRGTLAARSPASTAGWVVIPPSSAPDPAPLTLDWPGTFPPDVRIQWSSSVPIAKTPLGPHQLSLKARVIGAEDNAPPLLAYEGPLSDLPISMPASGPLVWRIAAASNQPTQYIAIVRRTDINQAVEVSMRIIDPLRRAAESLATIAPGHILPDPVLDDFELITTVVPAGQMLRWTSSNPIDLSAYTLRVTIFRGPFIDGGIFIRPTFSQQFLLSDVRLEEPGPVPPGTDPLRVRRIPGEGPSYQYYAFVRVPFSRIQVRLSSTDGRTTQHTEVST